MRFFDFLHSSTLDCGPVVNIDGTPMIPNSSIDVLGKPYGVVDIFCQERLPIGGHDIFSSSSCSFGNSTTLFDF